ncbi:MAG: acyclic terpene utilization AtuA family protein [Hyphomicrobiaceae bacterium]
MLRLGCGAGFSSDRLGPAVDLAREGRLDFLVFECIGERTMAFGHRDRLLDPKRGYNPQLAARMRAVLPHCRANGTRIVTNMGVANVRAAGDVVIAVARELGLGGLKVALVLGDDVTALFGPEARLDDHPGGTVAAVGKPVAGANVYLGADAIVPALAAGADVVITGRVADPSLFLAPIQATYGWATDDWPRLGQGSMIGHLLECGMQVTGGYFADPGFKDVAGLADCGFPIAEVAADGSAVITKLETAGGVVDRRTVKEQLLYEVHDPAAYLTPDVTADFSTTTIDEVGRDRVAVGGAGGRRRPERLKVTVGFDGGWLGEAGVSYAGLNAEARGRLAVDILRARLDRMGAPFDTARLDLVGVDSLHATARTGNAPVDPGVADVRVRAALRTDDRSAVEMLLWEVESLLCCGPAGGGGYRGQIVPGVVTYSAFIDRAHVQPSFEVLVA